MIDACGFLLLRGRSPLRRFVVSTCLKNLLKSRKGPQNDMVGNGERFETLKIPLSKCGNKFMSVARVGLGRGL